MASHPTSLTNPAGNQATLHRLTEKCLNLFDQCLRFPGLAGHEFAWFEGYRARLRWWSFGLRAQSLGRASLDRRLAHREDVRDAIASLLKGLAEALEDCLAESRSLPPGITTDSDDVHSDASSPLSIGPAFSDASSDEAEESGGPVQGISKHYTRFIEMALESLLQFSVLIRKSGDKLKHKRADDDLKQIQMLAPETYAEFKAHLQTLILISPYEHSLLTWLESATTRQEIPQSVSIVIRAWLNSRLGPIQNRLVQANIVRRHRIMCLRRDGRQVMSVSSQPKHAPWPAAPTAGPPTSSARPPEPLRTAEPPRSHIVSTTLGAVPRTMDNESATRSATAIGSDFRMTAMRSGRASSVVSKLTRTGQNQDYPKPSVLEKSPQCPYCGFVLDMEYARNEKRWHGHIAHDLSPYTCLFPKCNSPYNLYTTKAQWLKHMSAAHSVTQWRCPECPLNFDDDDEEILFATEFEFEKHMLENHPNLFDPLDLPLWLEISERNIIEPVSCPLCLNDRNLVRLEYDEHIATHLHSFSLRALPWDFDLDEGVASAGSSDSPPPPGHRPVFDDDLDDDPGADPRNLQDAIKNLLAVFAQLREQPDGRDRLHVLSQPDTPQVTTLLAQVEAWASLAVSTTFQKQTCASLLCRLQDSLETLAVENLQDPARIADLGSSITLDLQALQECIYQRARQDHDIWQEAFRLLPVDTQKMVLAMIDGDETNSAPLADQLDTLVKLSWKLEESCSEAAQAREHETARDIVASVQLLADDESIFLLPPTNLPWAALSGVMRTVIELLGRTTLSVYDELKRSNTLWALQFAFRAINRGRLYGLAYTLENTPEEALAELRHTLMTLYRALLELLINTESKSAAMKERAIARAIAEPKTASGLIGKLYLLVDKLETEVEACQRSKLLDIDADILSLLENAPSIRPDPALDNGESQNGDGPYDGEDNDEGWNLTDLQWISPLSFEQIHKHLQEKKTPGTCEWLVSREDFGNWQNSQVSATFVLRGSPGTGKTFISAAVIDHVREKTAASPAPEGLAFLYCGELDSATRQTSSTLLLSLMRQLLPVGDQRIIRVIKKLARVWDDAESNDPELVKDMVDEWLVEILSFYPATTIVLDGLDRLAPLALSELASTLASVLRSSPRPLRLFLSSRYSRHVSLLSGCSTLWYQTSLQQWRADGDLASETALPHIFFDMERVVTQEWNKIPPGVRDAVVRKSEGVFLYAVLQARQLLTLGTDEVTTSTLEGLPVPEVMLKLYQEADARIRELGHDEETLVRRALGLVLSAGSRLLTSAELLSALRIDPEREDSQLRDLTEEWLLDSCPEILTLDWNAQVGPVWRFTHATCATFFESMKAEGHLNSARIYLKLLLANRPGHLAGSSLDDDPIFDPAHPLQVYARHHWVLPILMHQSSANSPDPMLCRLLQKFLGCPRSSSPAYQQWYKAVTADLHPPPSTAFPQSVLDFTGPETQSVFTVCRYSLFDLLEDWWTEPAVDLSIRNAKGQTPLEIVNIQHPESFAIGRRLVELGIDVNTTQAGRCTTALASAVSTGDAEWVQFLINHGASVDPDPGSALALAAEMDRLDLVRMLIQAGALVDADEDALGCGSVLAVAAVSAGPEVVRELIDAGADVKKRLNSGRFGSALAAAAAVGNLLCLYALLDAGADPNQELLVSDYGSALEAAACHGQLDCLLALLVAGADVNRLLFAGEYGCALAAAATGGYQACVDALLQNGADANLVLPDREQRLVGSILAASIPHKGCMRLLIDAGADINQPLPPGNHLFASGASRGKGGSPLAIAVEAGRVDCLEMLISAGADVNLLHVSEGLQCGSPLVAAAFAGSTGCLTALIKAGARVDQQTRVGIYGTALMAAAGQGQLECLRTLVAAGADVDKQVDGHPGPCQTALIAAAYMGRPECVEFLVEHGATVDQRLNGPFGNALQAALTDVSDQELARCGREREPGSLARLRPSARGGPPQSLSKGKARVVQLLKGYGAQVEESVL